ncbi:HAD family phosphatase [candidate division KSB1 bacterium]|nr:HAD family phosphatase [candidate division KSB1 bacterium]
MISRPELKAIIFDNDGVLVDSEPLHHLAEKMTLAHFGFDYSEADYSLYVGVGMHKMFGEWIRKYQLNVSPAQLSDLHEQNLIQIFQAKLQLTPNLLVFLQYLTFKKYQLAVASSSSRKLVTVGLTKWQLTPYFEVIVTGDEVQHTKPAPEIYLLAASRLGVAPHQCLAIEDSQVGMQAAKAAGMYGVGYHNPHCGPQDLSLADRIIYDFLELCQEPVPLC